MASVDCIYLTRLLGICMKNQVSLITQLMPLGSLLEYIRDTRYKSKISSRQMLTWCLQISRVNFFYSLIFYPTFCPSQIYEGSMYT